MTKLEKAKRLTLEKWKRKLYSILEENDDQFWRLTQKCQFCKEYDPKSKFSELDCSKCPIRILEKPDYSAPHILEACYEIYQPINYDVIVHEYEDALTRCLALLIYLHQF